MKLSGDHLAGAEYLAFHDETQLSCRQEQRRQVCSCFSPPAVQAGGFCIPDPQGFASPHWAAFRPPAAPGDCSMPLSPYSKANRPIKATCRSSKRKVRQLSLRGFFRSRNVKHQYDLTSSLQEGTSHRLCLYIEPFHWLPCICCLRGLRQESPILNNCHLAATLAPGGKNSRQANQKTARSFAFC